MIYLNSKEYCNEIKMLSEEKIPYIKLKNKSILITGASGLIGSFIVDTIMYMNEHDLNCNVYALGKREKCPDQFKKYLDNKNFRYISHDVNNELFFDDNIDYILHLASNTHPVQYASSPISTILTNVIGTKNLLEFGVKKNIKRFLFASSVEVYGGNRGDTELFDENYCGYINSNTLRAGYPESKRCGEALCQAYAEEKQIDVVIARLSRIYGPTLLKDDSKAMSQFIFKALKKEDIILKSEGNQHYSYLYVYDAAFGIFVTLLLGENKEAYNISYPETDIKLRDVAETVAKYACTKVVFEIPNDIERKGFSGAINSRMSNDKIKKIGYEPRFDIETGIKRTIDILREINKEV